MNKKKVLLFSPSVISQMPLGLAYIAGIFEERGFDVKIVVNVFKNIKKKESMLLSARQFNPDVIGISFLTLGVLEVYDLALSLKNEFNVPLIAGGVHPTFEPEEALGNGFDIVVRGEGEETVRELCDNFHDGTFHSLNNIDGITYKSGSENIHNPNRQRINDLDSLPFPARHLFDQEDFVLPDGSLKGYERIFFGRGCPAKCTYCESAFGRKYHNRSVENVIQEIRNVKSVYGLTRFTIGDDTFSLNKKLTSDICNALIDSGLNISWTCGTRVNNLTKEILLKMKEAGCEIISIGAESGNEETLRLIRKGQKAEDIEKAVKLISESGIKVYFNIMTGFPWETPDHVDDSIKIIERLSPWIYIISVLGTVVPVPGTYMYDNYHEEYGYTKYWLRDDPVYQNAGQALFQNVTNPYELSVFYQRNMYDDIYVYNETFYRYSIEYKEKVKELCFAVGKHNLKVRYDSALRRKAIYLLGKISRFVYETDPKLEIYFVNLLKKKNEFHNIRSADIKKVSAA